MVVDAAPTTLDSLLDPFSRRLDAGSALRITEFRVDERVQARVDTLAGRADNGVLSEDQTLATGSAQTG